MSLDSYKSLCDDFYLDMYVNTELDLPTQRDTILAFFERIQKQFPSMGNFCRRENNEYCLEEDRGTGQYRWVSLEADRINSGIINPPSFEHAYDQARLILELIPYMLGVNHLDIDLLDVTCTMDFDCADNHDEVIAEALVSQSAFNCFLDSSSIRPIDFSPSMVVALSEDCRTQGRISIESKTAPDLTGSYDLDQQSSAEAISLSCTIRQYPKTTGRFDPLRSFENQCKLLEELMAEKIIPNFALPLTETIAQKRLNNFREGS